MTELSGWMVEVIGLFEKTLQSMMEIPVFLYLLAVLAFLMVSGLFGWLIYLGRNRKL